MACSESENLDVIAIGNGRHDQSSQDFASTLLYTSLKTISNFRCWISYPSFVSYRKTGFCAHGEENRCVRAGDLGTPLISANERTLVGVKSKTWVYTRLSTLHTHSYISQVDLKKRFRDVYE